MFHNQNGHFKKENKLGGVMDYKQISQDRIRYVMTRTLVKPQRSKPVVPILSHGHPWFELPNLLHSDFEYGPVETASFPMNKMVIFHSYGSLPEGIWR